MYCKKCGEYFCQCDAVIVERLKKRIEEFDKSIALSGIANERWLRDELQKILGEKP